MANPRKFSEKIALLNQKQAEETVAFEAIMREVSDVTSRTALSNLEEMQHNPMMYRGNERGRSMVGPMRPRPMEKRHDTSPYSGAPYLSPPLPDTWRRTNSDSALHQSANEACQAANAMPHRRDQHSMGNASGDNRDGHHGFIERPRSSCEMPRVPGIYIYPSTQSPEQQIPIGNNTGSLPDLSNVHFPTPLHGTLDHEEHSSSTQYSNNHLSVPVNSRYLHTCKGVALDNSTSTSQQELHSYAQQQQQQHQQQQQQPPTCHSPGHYIYQQPHSPVPPQSPKTSQSQQQQQQQQLNSLGSYRTSQQVHRPSPQSSPSLTVQGSPLSYSNNPSAPSSPTGHQAQPNLTSDRIDQNSYFINQAQATALQQTFEQFNMMDSTVDPNTMNTYIGSPNHTSNYTQNDMINVGGDLGSSDAGYFSTSPQMAYQPHTPTTTQQLTPQTPNTPTIILTDFSGTDDLTSPEFVKDLGSSMTGDFDPDLFTSDDALRQGLGPIDLDGLQMLTDPDMVISDANAEDHFRLDRL